MFTVTVKSRAFIARSFKGPQFGIAQNLHGATLSIGKVVCAHPFHGLLLVAAVKFAGKRLHDTNHYLIDIVEAETLLQSITQRYNYSNLDDHKFAEFKGMYVACGTRLFVATYLFWFGCAV